MRAQHKQFRLRPIESGKNLVPVWRGGLSYNGQTAVYDFREDSQDTFLTMRIGEHELTARLVKLDVGEEKSIPYIDDKLKKEIGSQMTIYFAEHLSNVNRLPETFEYV